MVDAKGVTETAKANEYSIYQQIKADKAKDASKIEKPKTVENKKSTGTGINTTDSSIISPEGQKASTQPQGTVKLSFWDRAKSFVSSWADRAMELYKDLTVAQKEEVKKDVSKAISIGKDETKSLKDRHEGINAEADNISKNGGMSVAMLITFKKLPSLEQKLIFLENYKNKMEGSKTTKEFKGYRADIELCCTNSMSDAEKKDARYIKFKGTVIEASGKKISEFSIKGTIKIASDKADQATATQCENDAVNLADVAKMDDVATEELGNPPDLVESGKKAKQDLSKFAETIIKVADEKGFALANRAQLAAIADGTYYATTAAPSKEKGGSKAFTLTMTPIEVHYGSEGSRAPKVNYINGVLHLLWGSKAEEEAQAESDHLKIMEKLSQEEKQQLQKQALKMLESNDPAVKQKGISLYIYLANTVNLTGLISSSPNP